MPRLAIVVLTWNGRDDTLACLASLRSETSAGDAVIVCDNGSSDGTEAAVRAAHPDIVYIQNGANLGFAGGNNTGIRHALRHDYEWVLLLNNDTLVPRGALAALLEHAARAPDVAAFQPLLVRASDPQTIDSAGHVIFRCPGAIDALMGRPVADAPAAPRSVFGACGAAALLRADVLRRADLLDESMFVIFEDVDLMFRIRMTGADVQLVPQVRIEHKRGVSGRGGSGDAARRRSFWLARNSIALALRYWPARWLLACSPVLALRAVRALWLSTRLPGEQCLPLWRSSWAHRSANRAAMKRLGLDVWFTVRP